MILGNVSALPVISRFLVALFDLSVYDKTLIIPFPAILGPYEVFNAGNSKKA